MRRLTVFFLLLVVLVPAGAMATSGGVTEVMFRVVDPSGDPIPYRAAWYQGTDGEYIAHTDAARTAPTVVGVESARGSITLYLYADDGLGFAPEWYQDASSQAAATVIDVSSGVDVDLGSIVLSRSKVVGTVTDAGTGLPIGGATVTLYAVSGPGLGNPTAVTGPNGTYEIAAVPSSDWRVFISKQGYVEEWHGDELVEWNSPVLTFGDDDAVRVDAALEPGGGRVGVVAVDIATGLYVTQAARNEGAMCYELFDLEGKLVAGAHSFAPDGWHIFGGVPAGDYYMRFRDCTLPREFGTLWYPGVRRRNHATPVTVEDGRYQNGGSFYVSRRCAKAWPGFVGTPGNDEMMGTSKADVFVLGDGDDYVDTRGGDDIVCAGPGNDTVVGGNGDDVLFGERGGDLLRGGGGDDTLHGGFGDDDLRGNNDADSLFGDQAADILDGGPGDDLLDGGPGIDEACFYRSLGAVVVNLATGIATGDGTDTLMRIERIIGSKLDDVLVGDETRNRLRGAAGDDELAGLAGDDVLVGGTGNDVLEGGEGTDVLAGNQGSDVCRTGEAVTGCP